MTTRLLIVFALVAGAGWFGACRGYFSAQEQSELPELRESFTQPHARVSDEREFTGLYVNEHFGFRAVIPNGLVGRNSPPPAPDNGFVLELGDSSKDRLSAYAEPRPFDNEIASVRDEFIAFAREGNKPMVLKSESRTELDGVAATQLEFADSLTDPRQIAMRLFAVRRCGESESPFLYVVSLDTESVSRDRNLTIFDQIERSWRMTDKCDF